MSKGLGKGLGALMGDFMEEPTQKSPYQMLPLHKVEPNPNQPQHKGTYSAITQLNLENVMLSTRSQ